MSLNELTRLEIIEKISAKQMSQKDGAASLGISCRHLRRLQQCYKTQGPAGLISKRRGQPSNHRITDEVRQQVLALIKEHYIDFKPTFAHEKLTEQHGFTFSVEWLRQLMIDSGLWKGKRAKPVMLHQSRTRRSAKGELVQIDGSHHDWFEGRAPACCLIVFVDDATSELMALNFATQETTQAYFDTCEQHLRQHGRPLGYYSDKHGVFRVNTPEALSGTGKTQFGRAMQELGIELICANSPQAKGRVEKMNGTLQDRLIKEMRLRSISDIPSANAFLPEFINEFNNRFAKLPASPVNAHRKALPNDKTLKLIFSQQHKRKLSKQLQLSYNNVIYQVKMNQPSYAMRGATVNVCERFGEITLLYKGRALFYETIDKHNQPTPIASRKQLNTRSKTSKPPCDHPWKKYPTGFSRKTLEQPSCLTD